MADFSVPPVLKHYRIEEPLHEDAASATFRGRDRRDGSTVILTVLRAEFARDPAAVDRFLREAQVAALLRSPYTVKVLDFGAQDGTPFLVTEEAEGRPVAALLGAGPLSPRRAAMIARDAARSLEEAEARGAVHGGITPAVLLASSGNSGQLAGYGAPRAPAGTAAGPFLSPLTYAAPELAARAPDARSDIYSLGASVIAMVSGHDPPPAATARLPDLSTMPPGLAAIVARAMARDPADRYASASEMAAALARFVMAPDAPSQAPAGPRGFGDPRSPAPPPARPPWPVDTAPPTVIQHEPRAPVFTGRLLPSGWADTRHGTFDYELLLETRAARPVSLALRAASDAGLHIGLPQEVTVAPGQPARVGVSVSAARRGWFGKVRTLPFQVVAQDAAGGTSVAFAGEFRDEPDRRARVIALVLAAAGVAALVVVVLGVSGAFGGSSKASPEPSPSPASSRTARSSPSAGPSATGSAAVEPARSISAGQWDYAFVVVRNTCGGDPIAGVEFNFSYLFNESAKPPDGFISDGEAVDLYQVNGPFLGNETFTWPEFSFSYPVQGGTAVVVNHFQDAHYGTATLTETYTLEGGGTCEIHLTDV